MRAEGLRRRLGIEGRRQSFGVDALHGVRRATVVVAHMDDEINLVGLLVRLRAAGVHLEIVVLTDGAANPWTDASIVGNRSHFECRRDELHASMRLLSIERSVLPQFPDSALSHHLAPATDALVQTLNDSHPDLLITFDPSGINQHPDHVATHLATRRALGRLSHAAALAMMTPPPPFCWALGSDFRWDRETTVMTLALSAAERATKAQVYETYASQWKTLRLLSGGLPPNIFFSLFPAEWYLWLPPDDAAAWARWADGQ